jgi:hypothetical protein
MATTIISSMSVTPRIRVSSVCMRSFVVRPLSTAESVKRADAYAYGTTSHFRVHQQITLSRNGFTDQSFGSVSRSREHAAKTQRAWWQSSRSRALDAEMRM